MTALLSTCGHEIKRTGYEVKYRDDWQGKRAMFHEVVCPRCLTVYKRKYKLLKIKKVMQNEKWNDYLA